MLKLKLDGPTYDKMFRRIILEEKDIIPPSEANEFI